MFSNPVLSYVKRWRVYTSLGENLRCLKEEGAYYRRYRFFPGDACEEEASSGSGATNRNGVALEREGEGKVGICVW